MIKSTEQDSFKRSQNSLSLWQITFASCREIRFVSGFINEVKWNLTQLTTRRAVTCCRSVVSAWWLKRCQPCLHHLHVLSAAFHGGPSLRLAFGSFFLFFYPHPSSPFLFPLINQCDMCLARIYRGLACSRRSVSRVRCSDDGERVKSYAEETRGRKWGDSGASSLPFPFSLPFFFFVNFSTALYYLNAWNRLTRGWLCQNWKPLDKPGTHLH